MQYLLDTNICIYAIKKKPEKVIERLRQTAITDVGISSITLSELEYGVERSGSKQQNRIALAEFLAPLEIMHYDERAARFYGRIRSELEQAGEPIGPLDMLIAAHALALGCTLVTNNDREFKRVTALRIENWTR